MTDPEPHLDPSPPPTPPRAHRPAALLFLLALALLLGLGGGFMQLGELGSRKGGEGVAGVEETVEGGGMEFLCGEEEPTSGDRELWRAYREEVAASLPGTAGVDRALGVLNLLLCIGLAAGAILAFGRRERGRRLLRAALGLSLLHVLAEAVLVGLATAATVPVHRKWLDRLAAEGSGAIDPERLEMVRRFLLGFWWLVLAFQALLALYYLWAFLYLRRASTRAAFTG
jgi:hypothetical protein